MHNAKLIASTAILTILAMTYSTNAEDAPPQKTSPGQKLRIQLQAMEKRIRNLELATIEKDARMSELRKEVSSLKQKLTEQNSPASRPPNQQIPPHLRQGSPFQMTPEQAQRFQEKLNEHFKRNLDDLFEEPTWRENPDDWKFKRERNRDPRLDNKDRTAQTPPSRKPRLGVMISESTTELRERYRNNVPSGAFITNVTPGSPADRAALMEGDCVVRFDNLPIKSPQELKDAVNNTPAGTHTMSVLRRGKTITIRLKLEDPKEATREPRQTERFKQDGQWLRNREHTDNSRRNTTTKISVGALTLSAELKKLLKLSNEHHNKMDDVLIEHHKKLNKDYTLMLDRNTRALGEADQELLKALIRKHVAQAETTLSKILTEKQIKMWQDYRERNSSISIQRSTEIEMNERPKEKKLIQERSEF